VIITALAVACGEATEAPQATTESTSALPPPKFSNYPAEANDFRFHWSAAPGIDLERGPAVAVRAYLESMRLAAFAGGDASVVYPGFLEATPENSGRPGTPGRLVQLEHIRPETRAEYEAEGLKYVERQVYGYQPTHIVSLEPQGEGYRATVCLGAYSVYRTDDADRSRYFSTAANEKTGEMLRDDSDIQLWRVELTDKDPRTATAPASSSVPQSGPMPAPADDVFGRWFITGANSSIWGQIGELENFDTEELQQKCKAAMPDDAAARMAMATGFHDAPPPHGEPIPGWPAANG